MKMYCKVCIFFDEEVLNVIFRNSFLEEDFWIYIDRFFEH